MATKRLPIGITSLLVKTVRFACAIAYGVFLFTFIDYAVRTLPLIENILLNLFTKLGLILLIFILGIFILIAFFFIYILIEPFIVEKIIPQKIKIYLNIDKIEATYTSKAKDKRHDINDKGKSS